MTKKKAARAKPAKRKKPALARPVTEQTTGLAMFSSLPRPVRAPRNVEKLAIEFTNRLATGQYAAARAMTSPAFQTGMTLDAMRVRFERLLEADDGEVVGPIRMVRSDMLDSGAASVYVSIGGENGEAVSVDVDREGDELRIIGIQWGRP